jgi:hypothetical protein
VRVIKRRNATPSTLSMIRRSSVSSEIDCVPNSSKCPILVSSSNVSLIGAMSGNHESDNHFPGIRSGVLTAFQACAEIASHIRPIAKSLVKIGGYSDDADDLRRSQSSFGLVRKFRG